VTKVASAWDALSRERMAADGWLTRRIFPDSTIALYAAIHQPDNARALLVEIGAEAIRSDTDYPMALGFDVFPETIKSGPRGRVRLCLALSDERRRDLFQLLAEDVAEHTARAVEEKNAVGAFLERLTVWQRFFKNHAEGLSTEEQEGLFGELSLFKWLLGKGVSAEGLLAAWQGPARALRDFCFAGCHVEVKTTMSPGGFHVNSLQQLDESEARQPLFVAFYNLVNHPEGMTLADLVGSVRLETGGHGTLAAEQLEHRLLQYGYSNAHMANYSTRRWRERRRQFFHVQGEFPRIRREELRRGIGNVRYEVAVESCLEFSVTEQQILDLVGEGT